jgi:cellulose synthase/poly-beta-1,6-N-acetylglucosamine synthase-like glycosyltransferase
MIWIVNMSLLYIGFLGLGILLVIAKQIQGDKSIRECVKSLCVIVPFRNESNRIGALLASLNKAVIPEGLDVQFIFVDDNSTDYSHQSIISQLKRTFEILPTSGKGKKAAIHTAIKVTDKRYILTLDADIEVPANYFYEIAQLKQDDLIILPVNMKRKHFFQKLAALEFSWLQTLTFAAQKMGMPILANGANLLFSKKSYLEVYEVRTDLEIASGDDIYLLKALAKGKYSINSAVHADLRVQTEAPGDWETLLHQRKRWLSKMKGTFGLFEAVGAFVLFIYAFGFIFPLLFLSDSYVALLPLALKLTLDFILLIEERREEFSLKDVLAIIAFQFWYPFYLVGLLLPAKGKEERWQA